MFESYKRKGDFIGMDMCRKFLERVSRARRYANHKDGKNIIQIEQSNHKKVTH